MRRTIKDDCPLSAITIPARHGVRNGDAAEGDTHKRAASVRWRGGIFCAVMLFLSFLSSCSKDTGEKAPVVPVQVATVEKTTLQRMVTAEAVLFPLQQSAIVPKISAPVKAFYVKRGSRVRKGQLLAVLENRDLAAAAQENQGAYNQAEATYATTTSAQLPEEIQKAQLDTQAAKQMLEAQQKIYNSRQELFQQGAIPRKELDQAGVDLTQARNQTRSPIDGVVTDRPLYPGEMAAAGTPIVTVMDISQVIAKAHIPQPEAALLKVGDKATITVPGESEPVDAKVTVVSPALDPNSTTVEVWVQAKNPKQRLKPGTSVQVSMVAQTIPDALVIPAAALLTGQDGTTTVMVVGADNRAHQKPVSVGIRQGDQVQITEGLQAGDHVVASGAYGLPDNTQVTVAAQTDEKQNEKQDEKQNEK